MIFEINKNVLVEEALSLGQKVGLGAVTLGGAAGLGYLGHEAGFHIGNEEDVKNVTDNVEKKYNDYKTSFNNVLQDPDKYATTREDGGVDKFIIKDAINSKLPLFKNFNYNPDTNTVNINQVQLKDQIMDDTKYMHDHDRGKALSYGNIGTGIGVLGGGLAAGTLAHKTINKNKTRNIK